MEKRRIKRLPVVRGDEVVGIVSRANLVHALAGLAREVKPAAASDQAIRDRIVAELAGQSWAPTAISTLSSGMGSWSSGARSPTSGSAPRSSWLRNSPGVKGVNDHLVWVDALSDLLFCLSDEEVVQAKAS